MADETIQALAFLHREPLLRVQSLAAFRRGTARILGQHQEGLLVHDRYSGLHFLSADSEQAVQALLPLLPEVQVLVSDYAPMDAFIMKQRGYRGRLACINAVYQNMAPIPTDSRLQLQPLPLHMAEMVAALNDTHDQQEIEGFIRQERLLGGYLGDVLVGFAGWHEDDSLGMLHVFEEHRRQGHAQALVALMVNQSLAKGYLPFGQVAADNHASLALQQKMGLTLSDKTVSWLFNEEE
ncbi:MAG: GNAT family N-acetyltransferase [Clostridiales bacterium]|nr:GNAT family N-acetyltransferase [Clostridiales bacterium]